jgi:DNA-binding response OmpR family regulator
MEKNTSAGAGACLSTSAGGDARATVLVVEDDDLLRTLVAEALQDQGFEVVEAADGVMALAVLQSDARIDLLMTDVGLPGGMSGLDLARAARAERPDLGVLFVTGYPEDATFKDGQPVTGTQVLAKPFSIPMLVERIGALFDGAGCDQPSVGFR